MTPSRRRGRGRVALRCLLAAGLFATCGPAIGSPVGSPTPAPRDPSSSPSPSLGPSPSPSPSLSGEPAAEAPGATIVAGDAYIAGTVGGFTFGRWSQGTPWLPAVALATVPVEAGAPLAVELDGTATIESWAARVATAADTAGDRPTAIGSGGYPVLFPAPPPGDWVLAVTITYGDGMGSGAYYWRVVAL